MIYRYGRWSLRAILTANYQIKATIGYLDSGFSRLSVFIGANRAYVTNTTT